MTKQRRDEILSYVELNTKLSPHSPNSTLREWLRQAISEIERLTQERDAAVKDIQRDCNTCNHRMNDGDCMLLEERFNCNRWQWRGAREVGNDQEGI
jgi:hypothetical protein